MGKEAEEAAAREAAEATEEAAENAAEGAADEAAEDESADDEDETDEPDKHGHPGISKGKYARDIKAKDAKIAELEAKLEEANKSEEGRKELKQEIADLKEQMEADKVTYALELAGCRNVKAAKAVLEDFDGDVAALKEKHPYLFEQKPSGSTGGKPTGAAAGDDDKLDRVFGLK